MFRLSFLWCFFLWEGRYSVWVSHIRRGWHYNLKFEIWNKATHRSSADKSLELRRGGEGGVLISCTAVVIRPLTLASLRIPGRDMSGFHRPGRHRFLCCTKKAQSAGLEAGCSASRMMRGASCTPLLLLLLYLNNNRSFFVRRTSSGRTTWEILRVSFNDPLSGGGVRLFSLFLLLPVVVVLMDFLFYLVTFLCSSKCSLLLCRVYVQQQVVGIVIAVVFLLVLLWWC